MKLRLEATKEELRTKAPALLKALQQCFEEHAPEAAELLSKALSSQEAQEHEGEAHPMPAVEAMIARANKLYASTLTAMLDEIGVALDLHIDETLAAAPALPDNVVALNAKKG